MLVIKHVLVLCVGNICRSPMAEALLRESLADDPDRVVESAGLAAMVGYPADDYAIELMDECGLDIRAHRARQLTPEMIRKADLILVMESAHRAALDIIEPTARAKVFRLAQWRDKEIADPYRQSKAVFALTLDGIREGVGDWVSRIKV